MGTMRAMVAARVRVTVGHQLAYPVYVGGFSSSLKFAPGELFVWFGPDCPWWGVWFWSLLVRTAVKLRYTRES